MPFTIAHSVTAKPIHSLSRGRLRLPGLAVGAMAPDFEYLVHLSPTRTIGHTIPGLFVLCLPSALVVLLVWHRLVGPVLATLLRPGTGGLTNGWPTLGGSRRHCQGDTPCPPGPVRFGPPAHFAWLCASILIGSFSHITWDAFTHSSGVVVNLWSGFSHPIGPGDLPVYRWLQYGCSVFGMAVLGVWAHRASQRPAQAGDVAEGDPQERVRDAAGVGGVPQKNSVVLSRTRRAVAAAVVGGLLLMGAVGSVQGAGQGDTLDVLKGGIIGALAGTLLSLLLSCAALTRRPGMLET
jgi:membrane-bound metal-dependent hydrolase YbcI (DUF457 family)